jgi:FkbM family methyltransferase
MNTHTHSPLVRIAQACTPPVLWQIMRRLRRSPPQRYYGLNGLDQKLREYLDYDRGYFVELGATDGVSQSNTLFLERNKKWRGVLIEPSLNKFLECTKARSRENAIYCAACVPFNYQDKFVELLYSNLMTVPSSLPGRIADPQSHARKGEQFLKEHERVVRFGAEARTLTDILIDAEAPDKMDLLSLDVEGAELQVLYGLDHQRFRFKYLLIEYDDFDALDEYLRPLGYKYVDRLSHHDWLFMDAA